MQQKGRRDVICQNPRDATGSAEASDHLRNALAPHSRESPFEIIQIQEALPGLGNSYYLQGGLIASSKTRRYNGACTQRDDCKRSNVNPRLFLGRRSFFRIIVRLENIYTECPKAPAKFIRDRFRDVGPLALYLKTACLLENKDIYEYKNIVHVFFLHAGIDHNQVARPFGRLNR